MSGRRIKLLSDIRRDLSDRGTWERRQQVWYEMRHKGLRRTNKPFPNAADMHFPLGDTNITKLKPYYFEQLYATEHLANFVALSGGVNRDAMITAARWFDFQVKQRSNLETEILTGIDWMLQTGRGVMKVTWDPSGGRVKFDAIESNKFVVPYGTVDLESADRMTHVMVMSEGAFRRNENYRGGEDFIRRLKGEGTDDEGDDAGYRTEKAVREGLTQTNEEDKIILWEVYTRQPTGWLVETFSPRAPLEDVRTAFELPYEHGLAPFVDFPYEIKDKGWYSPRGLVELVAPFETALCKTWNEKLDSMTFYNRPLFTTDRDVPNTANVMMRPGQILPYNIQAVSRPNPPVSWDEEMVNTRMVAEQRVGMPDFGLGQSINTRDRKTATEVNAVSTMMSNVSDLRMRIFRGSLGKLYRMAWSLLVQYGAKSLFYLYRDELAEVSEEILKVPFEIMPSGSMDGVNKSYLHQKSVTRFQMFNGDPYVDQGELRKSVMEADDAGLVKRLYRDPDTNAADATEEQASELGVMMLGYPASVSAADDHQMHLQVLIDFMQSEKAVGVTEETRELVLGHLDQHLTAYEQVDKNGARQLRAELSQMMGAEVAA